MKNKFKPGMPLVNGQAMVIICSDENRRREMSVRRRDYQRAVSQRKPTPPATLWRPPVFSEWIGFPAVDSQEDAWLRGLQKTWPDQHPF